MARHNYETVYGLISERSIAMTDTTDLAIRPATRSSANCAHAPDRRRMSFACQGAAERHRGVSRTPQPRQRPNQGAVPERFEPDAPRFAQICPSQSRQ